ncbi:uncharacterized protein LOC143225554 isoform X2 [Tachypleus tridentatus]|uniref:uncharacterized protein LOC143225554 isoform X2 n=1 Tax=Tachypleus tridentatus TaxID=6853 RepID=UPI003FD6B0DA
MHSKKYRVTDVYYKSDNKTSSSTSTALDGKSSKQLTPEGTSFLSAKWNTFLPWSCCVLLGLCALAFILSMWLVGRYSSLGQNSFYKNTLKIGQTGHFRNDPYPGARTLGKLVVYPHQESRGDKNSNNHYIISLDKERSIKENVDIMRRILNDYPEQGARHGGHPGSSISKTTLVSDNCTILKNYGYDTNGHVISPCIVLGFEKEKGNGIQDDATVREKIPFANITCKAKNHFEKTKFRKLEIYRRTGFSTKTTTGKYVRFLVMVQLLELQRGSNVTVNCWAQNTPKNVLTNENKVEIFFSFHGKNDSRPPMSESTIYDYESTSQKAKTTLNNTVEWSFNETTRAVTSDTITTDYSHRSNQTEILTLGKLTTDQNILFNQTNKQSIDMTISTNWTSDHTTEIATNVDVSKRLTSDQTAETATNVNVSKSWTFDYTTETATNVNVSKSWTSDLTTETVKEVIVNATTSGGFGQTSDTLPNINTSTDWTSDYTTETGASVNVSATWKSNQTKETVTDMNLSAKWSSDHTTETTTDVSTSTDLISDHTTDNKKDVNVTTTWSSDQTKETTTDVNTSTDLISDHTTDSKNDVNVMTTLSSDQATETATDVNSATDWISDHTTDTEKDVNVKTSWTSHQATETATNVNVSTNQTTQTVTDVTEKTKTGIEFISTFKNITNFSTNSETPTTDNSINTGMSTLISHPNQSTSPGTADLANDDIFGGFNNVN